MLASVATFWLSHSAVGACRPESAMAHVLVLIRMASERSLKFAVAYERRLAIYVENKGREKSQRSLDSMLESEVESIVRDLEIRSHRETGTGGGPSQPHRPGPRPGQGPAVDALGPKRPDKPSGGGPAKDKQPKDLSKEVCFAHDPRESKVCPHGDKCQRLHLDTVKAEEASRFDKALASFQAGGRKGRNKGKGRGSR